MKKILSGLVIIFLIYIGFILLKPEPTQEVKKNEDITVTPTSVSNESSTPVSTQETSIFVPYWNVTDLDEMDQSNYDKIIYFGITVDTDGIKRDDPGYTSANTFMDSISSSKAYLAVRMLDTDMNVEILENPEVQEQVIEDVVVFAQEYGFQGIVLDLEMSVIPFTNVSDDITQFVHRMNKETVDRNLGFAMTIYGDNYFRSRPYNISKLGKLVDEMYIMTYDFHKSRGEPGPNYPLKGKATYGYDFEKMIQDFKQDVEPQKITIVYGMYGYNWTLGPQGQPLKQAVAQTLEDVRADYYPSCKQKNCVIKRDEESAETMITYTDDEGYKRVVWYEDEESVSRKEQYMNEQGISGKGYWAFGYY